MSGNCKNIAWGNKSKQIFCRFKTPSNIDKGLIIEAIFLDLLELYHQHLQPCKEYTQSKWFGCEDIVTPSALHFSVDVTWCCLFIEPLRNNQHSVYVLTFILLKSRKENQIKVMEFLC